MLDFDTKRWYQDFRNFMIYKSHARWKRLHPKFRAHYLGDKMEGYALVKGLCEIPKQYAFLTSVSQITPKLIRSLPTDGFVIKDCLGNSGKQVLCIEPFHDVETGRIMYRNHLQLGKGAMTCHQLVRHLWARMSVGKDLRQSGETRIIIEEYLSPGPLTSKTTSSTSGPPTSGKGIPPDYKIFVVDGKVRAIHLFWRLPSAKYEAAYTSNWKRVPLDQFYVDPNPKKVGYKDLPANFEFQLPSSKIRKRLTDTAHRLAKEHGALFCRYDFYVIGDRILLGEITPICGGIKNHAITRKALQRFYPADVRAKYRV